MNLPNMLRLSKKSYKTPASEQSPAGVVLFEVNLEPHPDPSESEEKQQPVGNSCLVARAKDGVERVVGASTEVCVVAVGASERDIASGLINDGIVAVGGDEVCNKASGLDYANESVRPPLAYPHKTACHCASSLVAFATTLSAPSPSTTARTIENIRFFIGVPLSLDKQCVILAWKDCTVKHLAIFTKIPLDIVRRNLLQYRVIIKI